MQAKGLPDDCFELRVLRRFRDAVLLPSPDGRAAVHRYYAVAPGIVDAINDREDAPRIWGHTHTDIMQAVKLVIAGDYRGAFTHYRAMTCRLRALT
jgi:hypothetical protein